MKKHTDFIAGVVWGLLLFLAPTFASGLFGLPFYDSVTKSIPSLVLLYLISSFLAFILYRFIFRRKDNPNASKGNIRSFSVFMLGLVVSFAIYLAIGLIGFSQGEFSL